VITLLGEWQALRTHAPFHKHQKCLTSLKYPNRINIFAQSTTPCPISQAALVTKVQSQVTTINTAHLFYRNTLLFNKIPQHIHLLSILLDSKKLRCNMNRPLAFPSIHEQPFPLPHCCAIGQLTSVASAAQTNDQSRREVLQHDDATSEIFTIVGN
jgi:hypothetical protein